MTRPPSPDPVLRVADAIGGLMEFWGFKRNLGRVWTVLYLETRPLSAPELCERLSLSSGTVSMTLSELGQWSAVRKAWMPGERRDHYEAETNIWKMISRVFRERELRQIQEAIETFRTAESELDQQRPSASPAEVEGIEFARERIDGLIELARIGERLLDAILAGESVDALPLVSFEESDE